MPARSTRTRRIVSPPAPSASTSTGRSCSRPLCDRSAEALLVFDYQSRHVVLQWLTGEHDPNVLELCVEHADRFRPPHGWSVDDAREPVVELRSVVADAVNG